MVRLHSELLNTGYRLWRHPHVSREKLVAFQNKKLRILINHAYKNVPYYRDLFKRNGLTPRDIRTPEDLADIPITSSKNFRMHPLGQITARNVNTDRLLTLNTSGSSGNPFTIRRGIWEEHLMNMFRIRAMRECGLRVLDRTAKIAATGLRGKEGLRTSLPRRLRQSLAVYREYQIDCFKTPEEIVGELNYLKPDIIRGYPAVISNLAPAFAAHGESKDFPRLIFSGGESLFPFRRNQIQEHFGVLAYDFYGANECNLAAWECPTTGNYHICDDNIVLEILKDGCPVNKGERGEVVVTCLHAYAMPFIRYNLGDVARKGNESCTCGQPFSTIESIQGRMHDYFYLPGGRAIHPVEIGMGMVKTDAAWIRQYQILQEKEDHVILFIWPIGTPPPDGLERIAKVARDVLGGDVEFHIQLADAIFFESSGKFRHCRSLVDSRCDEVDWEAL